MSEETLTKTFTAGQPVWVLTGAGAIDAVITQAPESPSTMYRVRYEGSERDFIQFANDIYARPTASAALVDALNRNAWLISHKAEQIAKNYPFAKPRIKVPAGEPNVGDKVWYYDGGDIPALVTVTDIDGATGDDGIMYATRIRIRTDGRYKSELWCEPRKLFMCRNDLISWMEQERREMLVYIGQLSEEQDAEDETAAADRQQERDEHVARERRELMVV